MLWSRLNGKLGRPAQGTSSWPQGPWQPKLSMLFGEAGSEGDVAPGKAEVGRVRSAAKCTSHHRLRTEFSECSHETVRGPSEIMSPQHYSLAGQRTLCISTILETETFWCSQS